MDKNKKNKIIGLSIGILVVLIIVVSSTYAYWQITRTQETPNDIVAACLNLDLNDASAENKGIDLDSAWPISDEEGKELTGYTFTVTNNCNQEINYIVGLNRVEEENYLQDSSIKLQLDDNSSFTYSNLSDVDYVDPDNTEYTARSSKQVSVESISAKGTNTHTIRVWVSENAPVTEQSKKFLGQVFIIGGQGIEVPECFKIADNGTITGYNYECGTEVKVPAEINGIQVKTINQLSFGIGNINFHDVQEKGTENVYELIHVVDSSIEDDVAELYLPENCDSHATCTLEDYKEAGLIVITNEEEYNAFDWEDYVVLSNFKVIHTLGERGLDNGYTNVETLDLSDAIYLEMIDIFSFQGSFKSDISLGDHCEHIVFSGSGDTGEYYNCKGSLKEVKFPENGALNTIMESAFESNQLSKVVIPSSVTSIGYGTFNDNPITEVIIKNSEGNITIDENAFPSTATITYNPN